MEVGPLCEKSAHMQALRFAPTTVTISCHRAINHSIKTSCSAPTNAVYLTSWENFVHGTPSSCHRSTWALPRTFSETSNMRPSRQLVIASRAQSCWSGRCTHVLGFGAIILGGIRKSRFDHRVFRIKCDGGSGRRCVGDSGRADRENPFLRGAPRVHACCRRRRCQGGQQVVQGTVRIETPNAGLRGGPEVHWTSGRGSLPIRGIGCVCDLCGCLTQTLRYRLPGVWVVELGDSVDPGGAVRHRPLYVMGRCLFCLAYLNMKQGARRLLVIRLVTNA